MASKTDMGSALASVPFFILTGPHSCLYRVLCCPVSRVVQSLCLVPIFRASVEAIFFVRVRVYPGAAWAAAVRPGFGDAREAAGDAVYGAVMVALSGSREPAPARALGRLV